MPNAAVNKNIYQLVNLHIYKQITQRHLLRIGMIKKPCLKASFEMSTNVTAFQFTWKVVPHSWCQFISIQYK